MIRTCKYLAKSGECLKLRDSAKRYSEPYFCGITNARSCALYEKKDVKV
jgi:hypothetical protein